jgi:hypothetical protein
VAAHAVKISASSPTCEIMTAAQWAYGADLTRSLTRWATTRACGNGGGPLPPFLVACCCSTRVGEVVAGVEGVGVLGAEDAFTVGEGVLV